MDTYVLVGGDGHITCHQGRHALVLLPQRAFVFHLTEIVVQVILTERVYLIFFGLKYAGML